MTQNPCEDGYTLWELSFSGYWTIVNVVLNMALEVPGGATADGTQIDQNYLTGTTNQLWIFPSIGDSSPRYHIYIYMKTTGRRTSSGISSRSVRASTAPSGARPTRIELSLACFGGARLRVS